jgi:YggT family protein
MLLRVLGFLLESVFVLLIGAALLRAYMNGLRVNMMVQPGVFVMALTNWLVKPLRRWLPQSLLRSRLDWASVLAALVLALAYALLWGGLIGWLAGDAVGMGFGGGLLAMALKLLLRVAVQTMSMLVLGYALISWVQPGSPVHGLLARLVDPLLSPLRRLVPAIGGVDLSALVLLLLLQICLMVLG